MPKEIASPSANMKKKPNRLTNKVMIFPPKKSKKFYNCKFCVAGNGLTVACQK
jgi:hypothetical protein